MPLNSGDLNRPISVLVPGTVQDDTGQPTKVLTPLLHTWAAIKTITSKEAYTIGAGFDAQVTHKITLRYPAVTIKQGMQVTSRDRSFLVQTATDPDDRHISLELMCLEQNR